MGTYHKLINMVLVAAVSNGVALSQTPLAGGNLTINGSLATAGVATFDVARRVLFTFGADESARTFTITGTDRYGRAQTEAVTGNATSTFSVKDFLTVSKIAVDAATAGALTVGTNAVASSAPYIVDRFVAVPHITAALTFSGTSTVEVEVSYNDFAPAWDMTGTQPTWFQPVAFQNRTSNIAANIEMPVSMVRLTNLAGTGASALRINTAMGTIR